MTAYRRYMELNMDDVPSRNRIRLFSPGPRGLTGCRSYAALGESTAGCKRILKFERLR